MKKLSFLLLLLKATTVLAQNVGIGTTTPAELLHIFSSSANTKIRLTSVATGARSGIDYATASGTSDLTRYGSAVNSSTAGVVMNDGTRLYASGGHLLIGNSAAQPIYFATNDEVKMTLNGSGNVGIGTSPTSFDRLVVSSTSGRAISGFTTYTPAVGNFTSAMAGFVFNTSERAHGVSGITQTGAGSTTPTIPGMYGVVGSAIETGYGVGAFGTNGAGGIISYVYAGSGKALVTYGAVQLQNIGEADGRVLTTDANGNATWQSLAGTHTHYGEFWTGNAITGLSITTSNSSGAALRALASSGTGAALGILSTSSSINGAGIIGINNSITATYHPYAENSGVSGVAGNGIGVYGASLSGVSIYGQKLNFGAAAGSVAIFENQKTGLSDAVVQIKGVSSQPALELNNGFLKVSGSTKTAFTITATAGNSSGHILTLNYPNAAATDILLVTHNYNPSGGPSAYHNYNVGVYWNGSTWAIYNENTTIPILGISFNVLVIKQ